MVAAYDLLDGLDLEAKKILADKGYDSADFIASIEKRKGIVVIPPRSYRKTPREYDRELYKNRNLIERLFGRMKRFKRFALRCEKTAKSFLSVVYFIAVFVTIAIGI